MTERFKPVIPEYVKYMADDSLFNAKDICEMFGFKQRTSVHKLVNRGQLPPHDRETEGFRKNGLDRFLWKKSTIMDYINKTW